MTTPFTLQGSLSTGSSELRALSVVGSFSSKAEFELVLTGSGTATVDFGTVTNGAKVVHVEVDEETTDPVIVRFNGSVTGGIQVSAGGYIDIGNPAPDVDGVLSMDIDYTSNVVVTVVLLG